MEGLLNALPELVPVTEDEGAAVGQGVAFAVGGTSVGPHDLRPLDADCGVVPGHTTLVSGVVEIRDFVDELGLVAQDQKAVGKALGDIELFLVLRREENTVPLAEGGAALAQVNRDIKDLAADHADQLALGILFLEVESAQDAPDRHALVVLNKDHVQSGFLHVALVVGLHEISPVVAVHGGLDHIEPFYARLRHLDLSHISPVVLVVR